VYNVPQNLKSFTCQTWQRRGGDGTIYIPDNIREKNGRREGGI